MSENLPAPPEGNFLFYQSEDGKTRVRVVLDENTVWLSQKLMSELYDTSVANISIHLRNLFEDNELQQETVVKEYLITASDGKNYRTKCYNLDAILAVGYRVRSVRGTQFRRWATQTLREYLVKGFVLDDERLKAAEAQCDVRHWASNLVTTALGTRGECAVSHPPICAAPITIAGSTPSTLSRSSSISIRTF